MKLCWLNLFACSVAQYVMGGFNTNIKPCTGCFKFVDGTLYGQAKMVRKGVLAQLSMHFLKALLNFSSISPQLNLHASFNCGCKNKNLV